MTNQIANPKEARLPWSPTQVAMISLLLTPLVGGILHALNYARLGAPARWRLALFSNLIASTVFLLPFSNLAAVLFVSAYFYKSQEQLFQAHVSKGGRKASLVWPVVLTIAAFLTLLVGLVVLWTVFRLMN